MRSIRIILFCLGAISFLLAGCSGGAENKPLEKNEKAGDSLHKYNCHACYSFDSLYLLIRDRKIDKVKAKKEVNSLLKQVTEYCKSVKMDAYQKDQWVFPVVGYDASHIGGSHGEGYVTTNYDFFDGNDHVAHPAQDIFIRDSNQDCLDDRSHKEVKVCSVTGGIVISAIDQWTEGSAERGGVCCMIYEPYLKYVFYYAHLKKLSLKTSDRVKPGDIIGVLGRTGRNASKQRSPTHLHIMCLKVMDDGGLEPVNLYNDMVRISGK